MSRKGGDVGGGVERSIAGAFGIMIGLVLLWIFVGYAWGALF